MKYILVDAISSFRMRYAIAVPDSIPDDKAKEWAMDSVTCEDAKEFSQEWIGEYIASSRVADKAEVLKIFDEDNAYLKEWDDEMKLRCVLVINEDGQIVKGKNED